MQSHKSKSEPEPTLPETSSMKGQLQSSYRGRRKPEKILEDKKEENYQQCRGKGKRNLQLIGLQGPGQEGFQ
jgi:hypothetical protein